MENLLTQVGLTAPQAKAYLYMLEHNSVAPPALATKLGLSRTNTYKVLDRLVELGLASKIEVKKKLAYFPEDPIALASLVAEERNKVIALEHNIKDVVSDLRTKFKQTSSKDISVKTYRGKKAVIAAYEKQAVSGQPLYFIKSRADIPYMGFETMDYVRKLPQKYGNKRFGITQDTPEAPTNPALDKRTNLKRTWIRPTDYIAPVEWSVNGNSLDITIFDKEPAVIQIINPLIVEAFNQIWNLLDRSLKAAPGYTAMPNNAKREL